MKQALAVQLFFVLVSSISAQQSPDVAARQQILSVLDRQVSGWNSGDIDRYMLGYSRTDSLRFASGGTVTYGWQTTLERYKKRYSTKEMMGVLSFTGISVDIISTDAAMVFGTWRLKRTKDEPWGLFTLFFRNINGEWRIVHDHTSSGD